MGILTLKGLGMPAPGNTSTVLGMPLGNVFLEPQTKRKAYFAFRFEDVMRVNNVRRGWTRKHPDGPFNRSFYDSSIWEKSEACEPEALKALMRDAVVHTSAICVLVGQILGKAVG